MGFLTGDPSTQSSNSSSNSSSSSSNLAYPYLLNASTPTMYNGAQASDMMSALLGLNGSATPQATPNFPNTPYPSAQTPVNNPQYISQSQPSKSLNGQPIKSVAGGALHDLPVSVITPPPITVPDLSTFTGTGLPGGDYSSYGGYGGTDGGYGGTYGVEPGNYTIDPSDYPGTNLSDLVGGSLEGGVGTGDTVGGVGGPGGPVISGGIPGGLLPDGPGPSNPADGGGIITPTTTPTSTPYTPQPMDASSALNNFANSAGMNFVRDQGTQAITGNAAGRGLLESGATGKALETFGQNLGSTYLNDYLAHLNDYAGIGTKNNALLTGAGGVSNSTGMLSSSGSGTGAKQGLLGQIGQLAPLAAAFA